MHVCLGTTPTIQQTMVFERVTVDAVNRAREVMRAASGKPINAARVLRTLGEDVAVCVPVGGDGAGFVLEDLRATGIKSRCVTVTAGMRTCVTVIDHATSTATELVEESERLSARDGEALLEAFTGTLVEAEIAILSGGLAPGIAGDFYARACAVCAAAKVPVVLDARGEALLAALEHRPLVVKPNRAELAETLHRTISDREGILAGMKELHRMGAQWVVVTMGREGALLGNGEAAWLIGAAPIEAVSAIGSGDAFAAGMAAGIARGREMPEACKLGAAAAATNALAPGAGFLRLDDVRRLESMISVERV